VAKEAALKMKELNYIHAEALGASEMKHGPIALIDSDKPKSTTIILFVLDNDTYEPLMNAVDQMSSRNAQLVIVTDCRHKILQHYDAKNKVGWKL
jgi:glucosamine--fructose-6-phosphate aminotransferase (isomerizing)